MYRFLSQNAVALVFLLLVAAFAAASLYGSSLLPPASYEPLGSAAFPKSLGLISLCLVALQIFTLFRTNSNRPDQNDQNSQETKNPPVSLVKYRKSSLMLATMVVYLATMSYGGIDFRISTSIFLCFSIFLLAHPANLKKAILIAGCSILLAVILDLVFKHLFYIDI